MVLNTWDTVAYPLLERAAEHFTESDEKLWLADLDVPALSEADPDVVQRQLKNLEADGYLRLDLRAHHVSAITDVTPKTLRAVGAWPNDETVGAAVVAALETMADREAEPERKGVLKEAASTLGKIGVSGAGQAFGAALRQIVGL